MARRTLWMTTLSLCAVTTVVVLVATLGGSPDGGSAPADAAPLTATSTPTASPDVSPDPTEPPATDEGRPPAGSEPAEAEPGSEPLVTAVEQDFVVLPAVAFEQPADYGNGVVAKLDVSRVEGRAAGPGERDGAAVLVTVTLTNGSPAAVDVTDTVVDLYTADGALGSLLMGDSRTAPFSGAVAPGASASATYVIRLPDASAGPGSPITVTVSYEAGSPAASFAGEV